MLLASLVIASAAYLLGSIPTGYLLMHCFRKQDIRAAGSGNIGATNVLRVGGKGLGAATFLLDVLKGCCAVWVGTLVWACMVSALHVFPAPSQRNCQAIAALFCVLGHMFPVWLHFRGGKGVATGFGVFLAAAPLCALAAIGVFIVVLALTRYVSVASILGAGSYPFWSCILAKGGHQPFFFAVECTVALLIIVKHHPNIRRLLAGTESRFGARKPA